MQKIEAIKAKAIHQPVPPRLQEYFSTLPEGSIYVGTQHQHGYLVNIHSSKWWGDTNGMTDKFFVPMRPLEELYEPRWVDTTQSLKGRILTL